MAEANMSDVQKYIEKRAKRDKAFAKNFETGYTEFKIGVILGQAREEAGLTQVAVARRLPVSRFIVSRSENHAGAVRLSTLRRYAEVVGLCLQIDLELR
jgi:HTH-type transcriptional regulator/antitoxin HipB